MNQMNPWHDRDSTQSEAAILPPEEDGGSRNDSACHYHLPADIRAEQASLIEVHHRTEEIKRESDGIWGPIGADALLGLIPVVGALYTFVVMLRLQNCAARARCPMGTRLQGFVLGSIDMVIGVFIGIGDILDAFFRSGAWFANGIQSEITRKLLMIEAAEQQLAQLGYLSDADVTRLRDALLRNGRREGAWQWWQIAGAILLLLIILGQFN